MNKKARSKLSAILIFGLLLLSVIPFSLGAEDLKVSTLSKDSELYKFYNVKQKQVTIKDNTNEKVSEITLNTPLDYHVAPGYQKVAEFTIQNYKSFEDFFGKIDLYDKNKAMTSVSRSLDLKYLTYKNIVVDDYETNCDYVWNSEFQNNTLSCEEDIIGSHIEEVEYWKPLDKIDLEKDDVLTIGVFTDVQIGDKIEWVPTLYGFEIPEWATWTADLNVDLENYLKFDEEDTTGSGTIIDSLGNNNATNSGTSNTTGKIKYAYEYISSEGDFLEFDSVTSEIVDNNFTIRAWVYPYSGSVSYTIFSQRQMGNTNPLIEIFINSDLNLSRFYLRDNTGAGFLSLSSPNNYVPQEQWTLIHYKKEGTNVSLYINGSYVNSATYSGGSWNNVNNQTIGINSYLGSDYFNGKIDEFFIASRGWTDEEILNDWNNGDGLTYTSSFNSAPNQPTLNSPADDETNVLTNAVLNATYSDPDGDVGNLTFYDASDDSVICSNTSIANNSFVSCTWSSLSELTDYQWYANGTDGAETTQSAVYNFSTGDFTAPSITPPANATQEFGTYFFVDFDATDSGTLDTWVVNDSNFTINSTGGLTNLTELSLGTYVMNVSVNDTYSNTGWVLYQVDVQDTTSPTIEVQSPTLSQNSTSQTLWFNATASETIDTWIIDYNGTNQSFTPNTELTLDDGDYNLSIWANDSSSNWGLNDTIKFSIDSTAPNITTSIPTDKVFERWGGDFYNISLDYSIIETHFNYANYSIFYPNGSLFVQNTSSAQTEQINISVITLGDYTWNLYSNDTFGNYQSKKIVFKVDLDDGGSGASVSIESEESIEGVVSQSSEEKGTFDWFFDNESLYLVICVLVLIVLAGKKTIIKK